MVQDRCFIGIFKRAGLPFVNWLPVRSPAQPRLVQMSIRPAHAAGADLDQHLPIAHQWNRPFPRHQRAAACSSTIAKEVVAIATTPYVGAAGGIGGGGTGIEGAGAGSRRFHKPCALNRSQPQRSQAIKAFASHNAQASISSR